MILWLENKIKLCTCSCHAWARLCNAGGGSPRGGIPFRRKGGPSIAPFRRRRVPSRTWRFGGSKSGGGFWRTCLPRSTGSGILRKDFVQLLLKYYYTLLELDEKNFYNLKFN